MNYVPTEQDLNAINRYLDDLMTSSEREQFLAVRLATESSLFELLCDYENTFNSRYFAEVHGKLQHDADIASDAAMSAIANVIADDIFPLLARLDKDARLCFLLRTLSHLDYSEIAQMLDLSPTMVMTQVHEIRRLILSKLSHETSAPSPAASQRGAL